MLNSFLQERFLMANVVKSANSEIEKSKHSGIKTMENLRKSEAEIEAYKGLFGKLRTSMSSIQGIEINAILGAIFTEFDNVVNCSDTMIKDLGSLAITDGRISSLIREKDAELQRLRDELTRVNKLKSTINNDAAHNRNISVLNEENNKLKNEISAMRADRGSAELVTSYKQQIQSLNRRISELEQEKSDLSSQVLNLEHELKVRCSVENFNSSVDIKRSTATNFKSEYNQSDLKKEISPMSKYNNLSSPKEEEFEVKMVTSQIEGSGSRDPSSYRASVQQVSSTYQTPASSEVSSDSRVSGTGITTSNVYQAGSVQKGAYQTGQGATYQTDGSGAYQSGANSGVYQSGSNSGIYQSGASGSTYQAGGSGTTYQAGGSGTTYQAGGSGSSSTYQAGGSGSTYQAGTSSGVLGGSGVSGGAGGATSTYQPYSYQSSTYRSGSGSGSGVGQPQGTTTIQGSSTIQGSTTTQGGTTQSSTYRYGGDRR